MIFNMQDFLLGLQKRIGTASNFNAPHLFCASSTAVTAAHCIILRGSSMSRYRLLAGLFDASLTEGQEPSREWKEIRDWHPHPLFKVEEGHQQSEEGDATDAIFLIK